MRGFKLGAIVFIALMLSLALQASPASPYSQQVGNIPPVASFGYSPPSPDTLDRVHFTDNSYDPDGTIVSWSWDFGDGTPPTCEWNPIHLYYNAGTYEVTLIVTDNGGATDTMSKTIKVTEAAPERPRWFVDADDVVGLTDLMIVAHHYGETESSPGWLPAADVDANGIMGLTDLMIVAYHYGESWEGGLTEMVLERLRNSRIVSIQPYKQINPVDFGIWPGPGTPLTEYDNTYLSKLNETLGIDVVIVGVGELITGYTNADVGMAGNIADMWIREAKNVVGVTREQLIEEAKLYLAVKEILVKYDADAITPESWILHPSPVCRAISCMGIVELRKQGVPSTCEGLIECVVNLMIGDYLSGKVGHCGDVTNARPYIIVDENGCVLSPEDINENVIIVCHCEGPINPHGDDRIPYNLCPHPHQSYVRENIILASVDLTPGIPAGEVVTVFKFDVYNKKASVYTGRTLRVVENIAGYICPCMAKYAVRIDHPENCYMLPNPVENIVFREFGDFGYHQMLYYGDLRKEITEFAESIGFDVVGDAWPS